MASGSGTSDCEEEEQEDSSSSNLIKHGSSLLSRNDNQDVSSAMKNLNITDRSETPLTGEDELSVFRQQWQRELETTPTPTRDSPQRLQPKEEVIESLSDEDKAKQLFLKGVELERAGQLYEAIQHYKRAMQILPDVETRLYETSEMRGDTPEEELETEEEPLADEAHPSDDEDAIEGEDLLARFQRILARKGVLCQPAVATMDGHISWLPFEVILVIMRWVVSADLDAGALELVSAVCRGFYVAAREPDIWRSLCVRTWGIECGTPRAGGYVSWRQMYVQRPRLRLNGCYISKTTYLRHGENSFQDHSYRPWYLIDYYRYLRFFPDGTVAMLLTADEPVACVSHLKHRLAKPGLGIMYGHYRLVGDKVVIVIKKSSEKKVPQASNTRFRARRKEPEQYEQTFHMELCVRNIRGRLNSQLAWQRYAVATRPEHWTQFDLVPGKFPPFAFSRVRSYTAESLAPLPPTHAYT